MGSDTSTVYTQTLHINKKLIDLLEDFLRVSNSICTQIQYPKFEHYQFFVDKTKFNISNVDCLNSLLKLIL